jgi:hypothetical protein
MKKMIFSTLLVLVFLAACMPQGEAVNLTPTVVVNPAPGEAGCKVTPHEYMAQGIPIPAVVLVNIPGVDGLSMYWKDGSPHGSYQTGSPIPVNQLHIAYPIADGSDSAPLIFLNSDESGLHLKINRAGQISNLIDFQQQVVVMSLIGIPARSTIAYSTLFPSPDGKSLRSEIFVGDYLTIASSAPALVVDSTESRYAIPVAIHRDSYEKNDGIWYTYGLFGIGGDSLTDERKGLYYLDLSSGQSLEFLGMGCQFSGLSTGQNWATWFYNGSVHAADLHTGQEVSYPLMRDYPRGAYASISPAEGVLAWLEGKGFQFDGTLDTTLRMATLNGNVIAEYPLSTFVQAAGLGEKIGVVPVGWMSPDNENLVVAVFSASTDQSALVYVDVNAGKITPFVSNGTFAGFAYP